MELKEQIRSFITSHLIIPEEDVDTAFEDDDNIFKMGFVNSLFAMRLLTYIEKQFGFTVDNEDISIENFKSVKNIVALIQKNQYRSK